MTAWTTVLWKSSLSRGFVSPVPFGRPLATAGADAGAGPPFLGWAFAAAGGLAAGAFCVVPCSFAMVSALVDRFAAPLADAELAAVREHLDPAPRRLVAPAADDEDVGERQRALALDDAALPQLLRRPLVLLHHVELFHQHPSGDGQDPQHLAALAPLLAGDDRYRVTASHVSLLHQMTSGASEMILVNCRSRIERGWIIGQDTWLRTLRIRQRFCLEIGRVSSMRTRSPTRLSLFSSCALSCFDIRMTRWYRGWRNTRSILTTRVFCIASDTTTPSRLFRSPTGSALPLAEHGVGPRQISPRLAQPRRVLGHPRRELEPEIEDLFRELTRLLDDFLLGEIAPLGGLHRRSLLIGLASPAAPSRLALPLIGLASPEAPSRLALPLIRPASATRTGWRCRSSAPRSGTTRAPRPAARRSSRTGCGRA